jgi:Zn-dependent membrane protease YugP
VSQTLKAKIKKYSKLRLENGMTGAEIASKMLADHGIYDVQVISTPGRLTDHYDPKKKTVNLSESVYNQRNAAAAAVAAHEVGHAVQHAKAYKWLQMRSDLVPYVSVASTYSQWVIFGGFILMGIVSAGLGQLVLLAGIIMFGLGTLFSFVTLPVEYDASNRALAWLKDNAIVNSDEYKYAEDSLKWAARTYVVAAVGSLATLLYYIMIFLGRD